MSAHIPLIGHPVAQLLQDPKSLSYMADSGISPPPRRHFVGISTKLYFSLAQTSAYTASILPLAQLASSLNITLFLAPSVLSLSTINTLLSTLPVSSPIYLAAQDSHWENSGAFTGCVSPTDLATVGVKFVELGHAERRRWFGETDSMVSKKARAVVGNGMVPLVCIGELLHGDIKAAVLECSVQVESILEVTGAGEEIVFAYEPVWAIGANAPASADYVVKVVGALRKLCVERGRGDDVNFLYGGSAGPGTWGKMSQGVDGLFLGRFAHDVGNLERVIKEVGGLNGGFKFPVDIRYHV